MKAGAVMLLLAALSCAGCTVFESPAPLRDDVGEMIAHPQFAAARAAAPDFTRDVLTRLARLDHELNAAK